MTRTDKLLKRIAAGMLIALACTILSVFCVDLTDVYAASGISVKEVNYNDSTITLNITGDDTRVYISDAKQKKWEYVPVAKSAEGSIKFDISWIPATKDYTLSIKGDVTTEPIKIIIPKQASKFKATYNAATGLVSFTNDDGRAVQWRKKNGYRWQNVGSEQALKSVLDGMIGNGATVVFRLAPVNGSGSNGGMRPSKEVTVTIPKKTEAPKITVNDTLMAIPVVKGMQYRYTDKNGIPEDPLGTWTDIEKNDNIQLSQIAGKAIDNGTDVYIQFRTKATKSKQISGNVTIMIPAQVKLTAEEKEGFKFEYRSSSSFVIKVAKASTTNLFEYCIISKDDVDAGITLDKPEELKWKEINSSDEVTVTNTKHAYDDGSQVYIRRKAKGTLGDDEYKIASDVYTLCNSIQYPGDVSAGEGCNMTSIAGTCRKDNSTGYLTFSFYSPSNGGVTKLRFAKTSSDAKEIAQSDFKSVVSENASAHGEDDKYIITTTIYSTAALESLLPSDNSESSVELTGLYCLGNSTEFNKFEDSLVKLTLYKASKVIDPDESLKTMIKSEFGWTDTDRIGYTKAIKRVFMSERIYGNEGYTSVSNTDQNVFRFVISLGSAGKNASPVTVTSLKYDGTVLSDDSTLYKLYYFEDDSSINKERYAIVELYADIIEKNPGITVRDENAKLYVTLSNGEVLSDVTINLMSSAKLKSGSTGATFNPDLVEATKTVTTTVDGNTTTREEPNRDYYIEYEVNISGYSGLTVMDATWNGSSILYDTDSAKGRIYISIAKVKALAEGSTGTETANVVIRFSNGFCITQGYRLTLLK